jgi:hypothetical protein
MAWIETIPDELAEGRLERLYDAARQRAGKVFNIVRVQSLNPDTLWTGIALYRNAMFGNSRPAGVRRATDLRAGPKQPRGCGTIAQARLG